jgi:hypothetical protein
VKETLGQIRSILADEIDLLRRVVASLSDHELVLATGCVGWRVADLVLHLRVSAEAALLGLSASTDDPADRDFVSYWHDWPPGRPPGFSEVRFTWACTAAYSRGESLQHHFDDVAKAVAQAVRSAPDGRVRFQGHVMETADFLGMWATEFALHHLDLLVEVTGQPAPAAEALEVAALTVEGLLDAARPWWWDSVTYIRKASGRSPLTPDEASRLGPLASKYPAFG